MEDDSLELLPLNTGDSAQHLAASFGDVGSDDPPDVAGDGGGGSSSSGGGGGARAVHVGNGSGDNDGVDDNGPTVRFLEERVDDDEEQQFTWRSVLFGALAGSMVTCSNMYIGLKSGWTFGASLFSAILGFAFVKAISTKLPPRFGGGYFGPKENCTLQTAGSAAGGLSSGFLTAIPALAWFGYTFEWYKLLLWTFLSAYFGLFFAVPLRHYAIIKQKLRFPSGTATAYTIQAMHEGAASAAAAERRATGEDGGEDGGGSSSSSNGGDGNDPSGSQRARLLLIMFASSFGWKLLTAFIPVLYNWPIFYWISMTGAHWAAEADRWNWSINVSPAFFGGGMLMGINAASSFFAGTVIAWAVIGPVLLAEGVVVTYTGFEDPINRVSAQFWLLWVGVSIMVVASVMELVCNWKILYHVIKGAVPPEWRDCNGCRRKKDDDYARQIDDKDEGAALAARALAADGEQSPDGIGGGIGGGGGGDGVVDEDEDEDPALPHERIPNWWWMGGLAVSSVLTIVVVSLMFDILWYEVLLALVLGFLFSFIGVQSTGETDINPLGVIGKVTQFVMAGVRNNVVTNLMCANIATACASQAVDMLQDLKTGHILRASPRAQFYSQCVGSAFGVGFTVGTYYIFASAFPCYLEKPQEDVHCEFPSPAASAWYGVAYVLQKGIAEALPHGAPWGMLCGALLAAALTLTKYLAPVPWKPFVPSASAFGIAFVNPLAFLGPVIFAGALTVHLWHWRRPTQCEHYSFSVASGLTAGEGVAGVVHALLLIAGVTAKVCAGVPESKCG